MARKIVDPEALSGDLEFRYDGHRRVVTGAVPELNQFGQPYITAREVTKDGEPTDVPRRYSIDKMRKK